MRTGVALLLAGLAVGCSGSDRSAERAPVAPLRVQGEGYEGVILPADAAGRGFMDADGTWVPTPEQVRVAESLLAAYVRGEAPERAPDLWRRLPEYRRQYIGLVHGGRRCIYVNLVLRACWKEDADGFDGDRQLVEVCDGGDAYVQAEFDVDARRFLWLGINGEA